MAKKLHKIAESYGGGSSGSDFLSTEDGSETLQNGINTNEPSNGDGQGSVPAGGQANHPVTPLGEQGHEVENESGEAPFNEALVDDNHANNGDGVSAGLLRFFVKTADETNFFLQNSTSGGVADSPQTMEDGHPREELSEQEGMDSVINNTPHPTNEADVSIARDPGVVDTDKIKENEEGKATPDINKGKTFAHLKSRPFFASSIAQSQFKKASNPDTDYKNHSNVGDVMYPDENDVKADRVSHDFGNGDQMSDGRGAGDAPLEGNEKTEESKNYSGIDNTAGLLRFFIRKADYGPVTPSSNPNSGQDDDEYLDTNGETTGYTGKGMTDGKGDFSNENDKVNDDSTKYRKKLRYNKTEDTEHYFNVSNSGSGGMGMEGDTQNFSGVDNT